MITKIKRWIVARGEVREADRVEHEARQERENHAFEIIYNDRTELQLKCGNCGWVGLVSQTQVIAHEPTYYTGPYLVPLYDYGKIERLRYSIEKAKLYCPTCLGVVWETPKLPMED